MANPIYHAIAEYTRAGDPSNGMRDQDTMYVLRGTREEISNYCFDTVYAAMQSYEASHPGVVLSITTHDTWEEGYNPGFNALCYEGDADGPFVLGMMVHLQVGIDL